jgi:hypothetical protein
MNATKIVEIKRTFCVLMDATTGFVINIENSIHNLSYTVVEVEDLSTGEVHYARYNGVNHAADLLTGGSLYLSSTNLDDAVKELSFRFMRGR